MRAQTQEDRGCLLHFESWRGLPVRVFMGLVFFALLGFLSACPSQQAVLLPSPSSHPVSSPLSSPSPALLISALPTATPSPSASLQVLRVERLHNAGKSYTRGVAVSGFTREIRGPFFTLTESSDTQVYYVHQDNGFFRRDLLTQAPKQYGSRQLSGKPVYTAGGVYGFQRSCIERFDTRTQVTSDFAGHCQEKGFKNGPVREARFDEILDMAPDGEGGLYISEQIPLRNGLRIRYLHDGVVETHFESAPIATAERLKGELFNYFSDLVCEGVCTPGSFTSQAPHEQFFKYYRWNPLPEYNVPYSFSLDEYEVEAGDGNSSEYFPNRQFRHIQTLPILRDGPEALATSWDHAFLQADNAHNLYFMNHLCGQAYIRRLDPQGRVTTLIRDLDAGPEMSGQILHPENRLKECASESATTLFAVDASRQRMYILSAGLYVLDLNTQQLQKMADLDAPPFNLKLTVSQMGVGPTGDLYLLGEEMAQPGLSSLYRVVTAAPALGKSAEDQYN